MSDSQILEELEEAEEQVGSIVFYVKSQIIVHTTCDIVYSKICSFLLTLLFFLRLKKLC